MRRPHPNAQELLVRLGQGRRSADMEIKPSRNGLWDVGPRAPDNKTKAVRLARVLAGGGLDLLRQELDAVRP